jgi:hypothetical protein
MGVWWHVLLLVSVILTLTAPPALGQINVNVGTLPAGKSVTIIFDAQINSPLPPGTLQISQQGTLSGANSPAILSDDPTTAALADPTLTQIGAVIGGGGGPGGPPVTEIPTLSQWGALLLAIVLLLLGGRRLYAQNRYQRWLWMVAMMGLLGTTLVIAQQTTPTVILTDQLLGDQNGNGRIDGGDRLRYTARLTNPGPGDLMNVVFTLTLDLNTTLVPGSLNTSPLALNQTAPIQLNTPTALTLQGSDAENDPLTFQITRFPFRGQLSGTPPNLTYTPQSGFTGTDELRFRTNDGKVNSNEEGIVTLTVSANQTPTAIAQSVTTDEDISVAITLSGTDPENDQLTFATGTQPTKGSLSGTPPNLTYTPNPNANGNDSFTFTANDGTSTSAPATISITINPINDPPSFTASNPPAVNENAGPQSVANWATFSAGPSDENTQAVVGYPVSNVSNAALFSTPPSVNPSGTLTYTPAANASGTSTFQVTVQDNGGTANGGVDTSAAQTFTITVAVVDDPPMAVNDAATVMEDDPATTITVLANDTDIDGGPISITSVTQSANGTVVITGGGTGLTYQPNPNYCNDPPGTTLDTFTYTLTPGGNTATVSVTVTCGNDAPLIDLDGTADDPGGDSDFAVTFTEGTPVVIVDAANLTVGDPDNPNLVSATVTITNLQDVGLETLTATTTGTSIAAAYTAATGVLSLTGADTLANYQTVLRTVTYNNTAQNPNTTVRLIDFVVNDGTTDSAIATSTVTINAINTAPSFTKGPDQTVNEDAGAQTVNPWATTLDDGDGNTQTLTFNVTNNTNAALFSAQPAISAAGVLTYTPAANANGTATITITLSDNGGTANGGADTSAAQTFTITVNAVNDAPSFTVGPNQTILEDSGPQTVNPWATSISPGPADEASQTVAFTITGNTNVALFSAGPTISPAGVLTYTPAANAFGSATITVTLSDNGSNVAPNINASASQNFTITVTNVNDVPVFTKGPDVTVNEDAGPVTANPWATGISAGPNEGGQTLTFNITNNTNPGLFSAGPAVNAAGVLTFTSATNANGSATITLVLQDNGGTANGGVNTTAAQIFVITVNPVNDPPSVTPPAAYAAQAHIGISIPDGATDLFEGSLITDVDGAGALPFSLTSGNGTSTNGGEVTINADGSFTYNPPVGFTGTDTFLYEICDSGVPGSACTDATATINVSGPRVWFVNNALGAAGDGRLSTPFNTLAAADTAANATGDRIFVFTGGSNYTGGFGLLTNQRLIGQGVVDTDFDTALGITPPVNSVARPSINGTRPTINGTINLATGVTARGFNVNHTTATGVSGSGATGLTINQVSVTTTTGVAVNLANSSGTVSFTSVSANGAPNGIVLNTTTGSFTVTGTGGAGTGGTIQNATGPGVSLTSTSAVSLASMNIAGGADDGIRGSTVTGLSLTGVQVTSNGNAVGEAGIDLTNLFGTSTWTGITVSGSAEDNVVIRNSSGALTSLNVTSSTFSNNSAIGNDGFLMDASGTASITASLTGNTFTAHRGDHFQAAAANSGNLNVVFANNTLTGGHATALGQGITINAATGVAFGGYTGRVDYDINGNNINGAILSAITVNLGTSGVAGVFDGFVRNNVIGTTGQALSCSTQAYGIGVDAHGNGTHTVAITGNTIRRCADRGIGVLANDGNGNLNLTVTGNTVTEMLDDNIPNGTPREAIELNLGATSTNVFGQIDGHTICLALGGAGGLANSLTGGTFKNGDIRIRQRFRTRVVLPSYTPPGGNNFDTASVITFLQSNNLPAGVTATATTNNDATFTGEGYFGGAACTLPQ